MAETKFFSVPFSGEQIIVTVTKKCADVDRWIRKIAYIHRHRLRSLLVGLDIEWRACIYPCTDENPPVALLQLCVGRRCLLFQLLHSDGIPNSLRAFLGNPMFGFVGVGVQGDAAKLFNHHGLLVARTVDLNRLALMVHNSEKEYGKMGLKRMANQVLGKVMEKPINITLSPWDAENLCYEQVEYASIDAFMSFQLGMKLFSDLVLNIRVHPYVYVSPRPHVYVSPCC